MSAKARLDRLTAAVQKQQKTKSTVQDVTFIKTSKEVLKIENATEYLVTCAQNNTPVEPLFWQTLLMMAKELNAQLLVIPMRYKNPTSRKDPMEDERRDEASGKYWWPEEVLPYLVENELQVHEKLRIMGHARIQATSPHPLGGMEGLAGGCSTVYGHPQMQMRTVPVPNHSTPKVMYTTGSVSALNYSKTKVGIRGEFHHTNAAVRITTRGKQFHIRPVNWSREYKNLCDLDRCYTPKGSKKIDRVEALVTGDEHAIWFADAVRKATYVGKNSMVAVLKPKRIVRHDVFDGYSISHWHEKDAFKRAAKASSQLGDLDWELNETIRHINETTPPDTENIIVASNHNEFLTRWLANGGGSGNDRNAKLFHLLSYLCLENTKVTKRGIFAPDAFALWVNHFKKATVSCRFLQRDESYVVQRVELGQHGDRGPNGARGSMINMSRIGIRTMSGHAHGPGIEKSVHQVGMSCEPGDYSVGPSNHMWAHGIVHSNGKKQICFILGEGDWR